MSDDLLTHALTTPLTDTTAEAAIAHAAKSLEAELLDTRSVAACLLIAERAKKLALTLLKVENLALHLADHR